MFETLIIETLGFENLTPRSSSILFGLGLGAMFGILAELTRICLRRAIAGPVDERRGALAVWLTALVVALIGTQALVAMDLVNFADHRFHAPNLPYAAIIIGGLIFGAGMVLTRGCLSRLTVLTGSGNLRALVVLFVAALSALATLKGVLAPLRQSLEAITIATPAALPVWLILIPAALLVALVIKTRTSPASLLGGAAIGGLVVLGWLGTGLLLQDEFDPITFESLSFTAPLADTMFWTAAASAVGGTFGTGLIAGVVLGAFASALLGGRFQWQSFESPAQMGRYLAGGAMMGVGGVLAGGCTIGAGVSGVSTLSTAALLSLGAIVLGGVIANRITSRSRSEFGAQPATQAPPQAV